MFTLQSMFRAVAKWFRPSPRVQIVRRDISRVTMDEWRKNGDNAKLAAKYVNNPEVRMMLDVLRCSGSPHNSMLGLEAPMEARAAWQSRTEGYTAALNDFELLAVPVRHEEQIEATYEPAEEETDKK